MKKMKERRYDGAVFFTQHWKGIGKTVGIGRYTGRGVAAKNGAARGVLAAETVDSGACISALYAVEGAKRGIRWHDLPKEIRAELKNFFESLE